MVRVVSYCCLFFCSVFSFTTQAQIVWQEDFKDVPNNATITTKWSVTKPPTSSNSDKLFQKRNNSPYGEVGIGGLGESFIIRNTGTESIWTSQDIDISYYGIAVVDISVTSVRTGSNDYVRVYYQSNDGNGFGPEVLMSEVVGTGSLSEESIPGSAIITGKQIRIIIKANENTPEGWLILPLYSYFGVDDIVVTGVETLYSRKSGNWTDDSSDASWSIYPMLGITPGASCGCKPDQNKRVIIQDGHTITVNANGAATIIEVQTGAALKWGTSNSVSLSLYRGGYFINDGIVDGNNRTDARLVFSQAFSYTVTSNNNNFTLDDFQLPVRATVTLNGTGSITLNDDLLFSTNSNGVVNNNITLSLRDISASSNTNNVVVNNHGTINQSGAFSNVGAAKLNNLSNGIWNWSYATTTQPPATLNCTAPGNTFNYSADGNQSVRGMVYHHVIFSGDVASTKTTQNHLTVNGDLTIEGNASLNVDSGNDNITIRGNWIVTSTNGNPFVEGTETVTFDGASNQTISNASGSETFHNISLAGSGVKSSLNYIDINGSLVIGGSALFDVDNNISVAANWTVTSDNTNPDPFDEGTYTVIWDGNGTLSTSYPGGETFNNLIVSNGTKTFNSRINISGDLTLENAAELRARAELYLGGNWTRTGTASFNEGTQTVILNGSANQTISNAAGETFYNLILDKPSGGIFLETQPSTNVSITKTMTFNKGIISTTANELITFVSGSSAVGDNSMSFVNGPVRKIGNTAFVFPTGSGSYWARIGVTPSGANTSTVFTAQYHVASPPSVSNLSGISRISQGEFWELTRSGTLSGNNNVITLYWENGARSGITSITPSSNLYVARYNGTNWVTAGPGSIPAGSTVSAGRVASANITAANIPSVTRYYTFATGIALPVNPLPIELIDFTAQELNNAVELKWQTASEINNDYFSIERTSDTETFQEITRLKGKGNSNSKINYSFIDTTPLAGKSYYRLKQVDYDGEFTYSTLRAVNFKGTANSATLNVYPNPSEGRNVVLELTEVKTAENNRIRIFNEYGILVHECLLTEESPGILRKEVQDLPKGIYILKAGPTLPLIKKLVIN